MQRTLASPSPARTHTLAFNGTFLQRGFWLYVWRIRPLSGEEVFYVGRTGDSSSPHAQSPFVRVGQHLGFNLNANQLRKHLARIGLDPEACEFEMIAHGPILGEGADQTEHKVRRDRIAAMEKALCDTMHSAGYRMMNTVKCRRSHDDRDALWNEALAAFASKLPRLREYLGRATAGDTHASDGLI